MIKSIKTTLTDYENSIKEKGYNGTVFIQKAEKESSVQETAKDYMSNFTLKKGLFKKGALKYFAEKSAEHKTLVNEILNKNINPQIEKTYIPLIWYRCEFDYKYLFCLKDDRYHSEGWTADHYAKEVSTHFKVFRGYPFSPFRNFCSDGSVKFIDNFNMYKNAEDNVSVYENLNIYEYAFGSVNFNEPKNLYEILSDRYLSFDPSQANEDLAKFVEGAFNKTFQQLKSENRYYSDYLIKWKWCSAQNINIMDSIVELIPFYSADFKLGNASISCYFIENGEKGDHSLISLGILNDKRFLIKKDDYDEMVMKNFR